MLDRVTLIFTNSLDITMDRVIRRIGPERIFRFNLDIWNEYELTIAAGDFRIANPAGGEVRRADVAKCLWRKPLSKYRLHGIQDAPPAVFYTEAEVFYVVRGDRHAALARRQVDLDRAQRP